MRDRDREIQRALERANFEALIRLDPRPSILGELLRRAQQRWLYQGVALHGQEVMRG